MVRRFHWLVFLFIVYTPLQAQGQDTLVVYFEFGESNIPEKEKENLLDLITTFDLKSLDSIHFIGMADSVGKLKSNIKLSQIRARNVARYCNRLFWNNIPTRISARGEKTNSNLEKNRRVDIVLHFNNHPDYTEIPTKQAKNVCYTIDYLLLHRSHIRTIKKRSKKWTFIETNSLDKKKVYYYGSKTKKGRFKTMKVKWSNRTTGKLWWSKTRSVALIPQSDFEKYKVFTIKELPCDTCHQDFQIKNQISHEDTCIQLDRFLMDNLQFKLLFFNRKFVKIRVPIEYVDTNDSYYMECRRNNKIVWKTKRRGRRKKYYYAKLPKLNSRVANITRVMQCCKNQHYTPYCHEKIIPCRCLAFSNGSLGFNAEIGNLTKEAKNGLYAGIGLSKQSKYHLGEFLISIDDNQNFLSTLRFQSHFLSFPFQSLKPINKWNCPAYSREVFSYGRLYLGTELWAYVEEDKQGYIDQNIHLGFAYVNTKNRSLIPRIFFQCGLAVNHLNERQSKNYPFFALGIKINIMSFP